MDAYASLLRMHEGAARRLALVLCGSGEADEAAQDGFVKAWYGLAGFRDGAAFRPWLLRIVANEARNRRRSAGRRAGYELRFAEDRASGGAAPSPEAAVLAADRRRTVGAALAGLPTGQRDVVACRYLVGLDEAETAAVLGLPRGHREVTGGPGAGAAARPAARAHRDRRDRRCLRRTTTWSWRCTSWANGSTSPATVDRSQAPSAGSGPPRRFLRGFGGPGDQTREQDDVLAAAAAVLLIGARRAVLVAPGSRHAVARWLGIGSVTVTYSGEVPAAAGRTYGLGTPVPLSQAVERADAAGWRLAAPSGAGDPSRAFVGRPAGGVNLTWAPSGELPEIRDSGIGLLLTAMPGTTDAGGMSKQARRGTTVQLVRVGDGPAYWIAGDPHEVVITDAEGDVVHDSARVASNTLVWTEGDITYRLESALDRDEVVELASTMRPLA